MLHVSSISHLTRQIRSVLSRRAERVHFRRELDQTSDRILADMGICRGDISGVVDGSYARR